MEILSSALLAGFPHGFTTRTGGVSKGPFASMNLGGRVGDAEADVEANWRRLAETTGLKFARVRQVHGDRVLVVEEAAPPREEADAIVQWYEHYRTAREGMAWK